MLIGITGGIGSGKTTVCQLLESFGFPVYYSDDRAKWLMENDLDVKNQLLGLFGNQTFQDGTLNRSFLAQQIFEDPQKRLQINAIVHPAVASDFEKWMKKQKQDLIFKESALLFETGIYKQADLNVLITAPKEVRIARVLARDGVERSAVEARINAQMSDEEKIKLADYVIDNHNQSDLTNEVQKLIQLLSNKQH